MWFGWIRFRWLMRLVFDVVLLIVLVEKLCF